MNEIDQLLLVIESIDGPTSSRQERMFKLALSIRSKLREYKERIGELVQVTEHYRVLADQRLLNHLQIDELHIIDIVNEVLPTLPTSELSQCTYPLDPEPIRISPIPVEEIDFKHD